MTATAAPRCTPCRGKGIRMNGQICPSCMGTGHLARPQRRTVNIPPAPLDHFAEMARARAVLAHSFARFKAFHDNAVGPTMSEMAARSAGHCLWALGVEEYGGIVALPMEGPIIDLKPPLPAKKEDIG